MKNLAALAGLLLLASHSFAQTSPAASSRKAKKAAKGASIPGERAPAKGAKKPVFDAGSQSDAHRGGTEITADGKSVQGGGIRQGSADKAPSANGGTGGGSGGGGGAAAPGTVSGAPVAAAGTATAAAAKKPVDPFAGLKTFTANSPSGPWIEGSPACNSGQVYTRTTGVDRTREPKGCASPAASEGCLDIANHRSFLASEWIDKNTIQTVVDGAAFRDGDYALYLSYSRSEIKRVGTMTLKNCAASCRWESTTAVFGPCDGPGTGSCTAGNRGATAFGCGGNWSCVCK